MAPSTTKHLRVPRTAAPTLAIACSLTLAACQPAAQPNGSEPAKVAGTPTKAQTAAGQFISWKEHLIDDVSIDGVPIQGSDGLSEADLDLDGIPDIVSVHESDVTYDGVADGTIRIAFGSPDPDRWQNITLADGAEAGAAEDVAIGDLNDDGYPDIVAACELSHLIVFINPGAGARTETWKRAIPKVTQDRGSYIRVFLGDFNGDGRLEAVAPNKGEQNPSLDTRKKDAISIFHIPADPLDGDGWIEQVLTRVVIPINSRPIDLDRDGDLDVLAGSRGEARILWLENTGETSGNGHSVFAEHPIRIQGSAAPEDMPRPPAFADLDAPLVTGFNLAFADLNADGRLDIVLVEARRYPVWLEQPAEPDQPWRLHPIGTTAPDSATGLRLADINDDGHVDLMTGAYSSGPRDRDGEEITVSDAIGRLAWFANPGPNGGSWMRHDISRRKRGMFDKFLARDLDRDGDIDFAGTRGNSAPYDGVYWLEQVRTDTALPAFSAARETDSQQMPLDS